MRINKRLLSGLFLVVTVLVCGKIPAAHAQQSMVSVYSGNTLTDSANANYNMNLTTTTFGGSTVYSNNMTVLYSTTYNTTTHTLGTLSSPTGLTGTAFANHGDTSYIGGAVPKAGVVSPYSSASGDAGYYLFQVPFRVTNAVAGQSYTIDGFIHSDNASFDVILDYGANQRVLTLTGNNIGSTANVATTNGVFKTNTNETGLNAAHTLSLVVYNNSGPMTTSFGFTAWTPEPSSLSLIAGLAVPGFSTGAVVFRLRRRKSRS